MRRVTVAALFGLIVSGIAAAPPGHSAGAGLIVVHPPRIQLGDASLAGYSGSELDRVTVMWQTTGSPAGDVFEVAVRVGTDWVGAGPVSVEDVGESRLMHRVELEGLQWNARHEYVVRHLRDGVEVGSWSSRFRTRLRAGDSRPFAFAAYGDSAWRVAPDPADRVQGAIADSPAAFTLLLGDNAYDDGTARDLDARFDPDLAPSSAALLARHIEYVAFGNHDIRTDGGRPSEIAFAVPVPEEGVDAPTAPPEFERPEHNYSFDHGMAHFLTFDTTSITSPDRLNALLDWVQEDMAASDARWKVVFGHHPVGGSPDKVGEIDRYPQYVTQVVERLVESGVDLFLVGHSHTVSWTFPLTGAPDGAIAFVEDSDGRFRAGEGPVQVVSGAGGRSLRHGRHDDPFVAAAWTLDSDPILEYGFVLIEVRGLELEVSYVAAEGGEVLGRFFIVIPTPAFGGARYAR
ncbi:MAG TPA: metallophosphoesterase family protein [Acidimicrobiia bacterium]|nr:metallophosphoesterase family protein [Acidimicrobiia bacterium]